MHQAPAKGWFYSPDIRFAAQFTQSGLPSEIQKIEVRDDSIFRDDPLPYGGDPDEVDATIARAKSLGFTSLWCSEGNGEPDSVFVMRGAILARDVKVLGRATEQELYV